MDRLPCGVLEVGEDRQILFCNQYAASMLAKSSGDLVGQRLETVVSAASRIVIDSYVYPLLLEESTAQELQFTLQTHEGKRIPVVTNIALLEDSTSIWTFMACENRDKLYEELLTTRDSLSERALELKNIYDQIEIDHENLQVFCQSLSHDFTGPIRRAQQMLSLVVRKLKSKEDTDVDDEVAKLDRVVNNLDALLVLVKGLVEYLIADAVVVEGEMVDLNDTMTAAIGLTEGQTSESVKITQESLPTVIGSSAQLQVLFKNLIGNAIKYNENSPEITISCDSSIKPGHHTITISDNGIGIPSEQLKRIFEPFTRLHSDSHYKGSGLGLSIVRKLVVQHNGEIAVESTPGEGSTFFITFPVATL